MTPPFGRRRTRLGRAERGPGAGTLGDNLVHRLELGGGSNCQQEPTVIDRSSWEEENAAYSTISLSNPERLVAPGQRYGWVCERQRIQASGPSRAQVVCGVIGRSALSFLESPVDRRGSGHVSSARGSSHGPRTQHPTRRRAAGRHPTILPGPRDNGSKLLRHVGLLGAEGVDHGQVGG